MDELLFVKIIFFRTLMCCCFYYVGKASQWLELLLLIVQYNLQHLARPTFERDKLRLTPRLRPPLRIVPPLLDELLHCGVVAVILVHVLPIANTFEAKLRLIVVPPPILRHVQTTTRAITPFSPAHVEEVEPLR